MTAIPRSYVGLTVVLFTTEATTPLLEVSWDGMREMASKCPERLVSARQELDRHKNSVGKEYCAHKRKDFCARITVIT